MGWNRTDLLVLVARLGLGQAGSVLALMRAAAGVPAAVPSCLRGKSSAEPHRHGMRNKEHSTCDEMHSTCNDNDSARCITLIFCFLLLCFLPSFLLLFLLLLLPPLFLFLLLLLPIFLLFLLLLLPLFLLFLLLLLCFVLFLLGLFRLTLDSLCRLCQQLLVGSLLGKDLSRRLGGLSGVGGRDGWW